MRVDGMVKMMVEGEVLITLYCHWDEAWTSMRVMDGELADIIAVVSWGPMQGWGDARKFYIVI